MKPILLFCLLLIFFSCGKEKVIQLPEINNSEINEISDVSVAYLFYDEAHPENIELNRKNLISTTNWLVNVDKRLTLKQVIPQIKFLQDKKRNAQMHNNENAKNYYTCNDTSKKTLGFMEFTHIIYHEESSETYISKLPDLKYSDSIKAISFNPDGKIAILNPNSKSVIVETPANELLKNIKAIDSMGNTVYLNFNENLLFQDYISYKSTLLRADLKHAKISNHEFLHF